MYESQRLIVDPNFEVFDLHWQQIVKPPDDPTDDTRDNFPGASLHDSSGDLDTVEQIPDSPPLHPDRELNPSIILEPTFPWST
ncbi:hypothetical protein BDR03DRAFT_739515 [Suillus americanus]|nr:hypothetical protein BDR03DRAFT_739515 [Suillus americanus]